MSPGSWPSSNALQVNACSRAVGVDTLRELKGVAISGGQAQLLGLARALLRKPKVLMLDEPTSAVDTVSEEAIHQELRSLKHKMTIIIIAHRSRLLALCDRVVNLGELKGQKNAIASSRPAPSPEVR